MAPKIGTIVRWGRTGRTFTEAYLSSGVRIELTEELRQQADVYGQRTLVFVERRGRLFKFVYWLGTPSEAVAAVRAGLLEPNEVDAGTQFLAEAETWATDRLHEAQLARGRAALELVAGLLTPDGPLSLTEVARISRGSMGLTEADLKAIRDKADSDPSHLEAMSKISGDALRVGHAVRSIRWPSPTDPAAVPAFRLAVDRAALVLEWAVAALAEPALSDAERIAMYGPLEAAMPLATIRDPRL